MSSPASPGKRGFSYLSLPLTELIVLLIGLFLGGTLPFSQAKGSGRLKGL